MSTPDNATWRRLVRRTAADGTVTYEWQHTATNGPTAKAQGRVLDTEPATAADWDAAQADLDIGATLDAAARCIAMPAADAGYALTVSKNGDKWQTDLGRPLADVPEHWQTAAALLARIEAMRDRLANDRPDARACGDLWRLSAAVATWQASVHRDPADARYRQDKARGQAPIERGRELLALDAGGLAEGLKPRSAAGRSNDLFRARHRGDDPPIPTDARALSRYRAAARKAGY